MKTSRLTTAGITAALAAVIFAGGTQPAGAYVAGDRDWANLEFQNESGGAVRSVYLDMNSWGTQYYDGLPPENNGGLGDGTVCLAVHGSNGHWGTACFDGAGNWSIDRLASATIDDTIMLEVRDPDDQVTTELAVIELTITAQGAAYYPGAGVTTTPDPGLEVAYSLRRDATVSGTISSPTFETIDLAGAWSTIGWDSCIGVIGVDNLTCRY